jgi:endonuclease/exonuclease/phosphatase (EEP) superfamily protein YafD
VARPLAFYTGVVCVATLLAFAGRWSWFCDLLVNFRTHYALLLLVALTAAGVLRCWRVAGVAAVGLALNLWPMHDVFAGSQSSPVAGARSVRLVSFNVHVANGDMARVAAYLASLEADIVVFQEMTRANADRVAELLPRLAYRYPAADPVAPDVLMLSRWPLVAPQLATRDGLVFAVRADVDLGDRRLRLYGAHLYWPVVPASAQGRNAQLAALGRELAECRGACVAVGDFNITPWSSHYRDLLKNSGFQDCARGQGWLPTWNPGLPAMLGIRIDHCLASGAVGVEGLRVGERLGSDHFATINDLSVGSQGLAPHDGNRRPEGAASM